uniref:Uncharacterized protein n=1 Tax=Guillardia theta TaxID=55529 RepID=A0A7S4P8D4_GUITH
MTMAGLLAGMFASCVTTPADVIKTRIQTNIGKSLASSSVQSHPRLVAAFSTNDDANSGCIKSTALSMVVEEGWHSFLSGVGPRVMRLAPGMAITLVIYETLQKVV